MAGEGYMVYFYWIGLNVVVVLTIYPTKLSLNFHKSNYSHLWQSFDPVLGMCKSDCKFHIGIVPWILRDKTVN